MIDLNETWERMLEAIGAADRTPGVCDASASDLAALDEFRLCLAAPSRDALLPALRGVFSRRFAELGRERLEEGLLQPLKKGLGNAEKRGNRGDRSKQIRVEAVVTRTGAAVAVADEGSGFDVEGVLDRRRRVETYFVHGGSGFQTFEKSTSLISYADGGRKLLLCFLCEPAPGRSLLPAERVALGRAADEDWMGLALAAELAPEKGAGFALRSCRILLAEQDEAGPELRYVLRYRDGASPGESRAVLVGRLLSGSGARTELAVARGLRAGAFREPCGLRIPKPLSVSGCPNLVLYEFEPILDLRGHLSRALGAGEAAATMRAAALGLRTLHASDLVLERQVGREELLSRWRCATQSVQLGLGDAVPESADRVERILRELEERGGAVSWDAAGPVHGSLAWDCLRSDGVAFHLYRLDQSCRSHAGVDVGAFLADLLRFHRVRRDRDASRYAPLRDAFLETYLAAGAALRPEDLPVFVVGSLLLRLERLMRRPRAKSLRKLGRVLGQCEALLEGDPHP